MIRKAFTLIELLVVIAIIAILAAILFPVFAQAKAAAKKSQSLSNVKQQALAVQMYLADNDDVHAQGYWYQNDSSSAGGYNHWTGVMQPYIKSFRLFVDPMDESNGLAPTNFEVGTNNLGYGIPGGQSSQYDLQDNQAPRLSYIANAALMGRKRRSIDPANVVLATAVDEPAATILITTMTSIPECINGTSVASGDAYKTHRPTNAILLEDDGAPFVGENTAEYTGVAGYWAITPDRAKADIASCTAGTPATGLSHITYMSPFRHNGKTVYAFADGHAAVMSLEATLNPNGFMWGKKMYSAGGRSIYKPGTVDENVD